MFESLSRLAVMLVELQLSLGRRVQTMTLTPSTATRRLSALALTIIFVVGGSSLAVADIVRHHLDRDTQHERSHVEVPGSCVDHSHRCDLGLSPTGPKFATTPQVHAPMDGEVSLSAGAGPRDVWTRHDLLRLPDSRAPPLLS